MTTRLYIIRHGETDWNRENRTQGCGNDMPLNDRGVIQAVKLGNRFRNLPVDAIYSSDLKRAVKTAEEISKTTSADIITTEKLREMSFGCWEGLTSGEIRSKYGSIYEVWRDKPSDALIPGAERLMDIQKRAMSAVHEILSGYHGKNIVVVTHGVTAKVLIVSMLGIDISMYNRIILNNTSVSIVDVNDNNSVLTLLNDTCHLDVEVNK